MSATSGSGAVLEIEQRDRCPLPRRQLLDRVQQVDVSRNGEGVQRIGCLFERGAKLFAAGRSRGDPDGDPAHPRTGLLVSGHLAPMREELDECFLCGFLGALSVVDDQITRSNNVRILGSVERGVLVLEPHGSLPGTQMM